MEENTTKITIKLKNLDKLKKLAIDNGQFERAGALSLKIKAAQSSLVKLEESKDHQNDISLLDDRLAVAKNELTMLEQELVTLKDEQSKDHYCNYEKLYEIIDVFSSNKLEIDSRATRETTERNASR